MTEVAKPSGVEVVKVASQQLRGSIDATLRSEVESFSSDDANLIKFHGFYQQDDRDQRGQKNADGTAKGKAYMFMVRTRIPGGRVTAKQFLDELDLCEKYGNGTVRITSRQGFQLHGVAKDNLKATIRAINDSKLTTFCACGDVERNVMACPAPIRNNPVRDAMQKLAYDLAEHLKPRTTAYWEIWLRDENGEDHKPAEFQPVEEPIYGPTYLPRKFKSAIALPEDNCVDVYTNDLGLLVIHENGKILGYNVLVGGGQGVTPSAKKTYPALAKPLAFVTPDQVLGVSEAIVKVQRDFGNRSDRKVARLKYTLASMGLEAFKAKVEEYYGQALPAPKPVEVSGVDDHLGWHEQGDGRWFLGINIENGRIKDEGSKRIKSGLRAILQKFEMETRLTALQSVLLCDITAEQRPEIDRMLREYGIQPVEELSLLRRYSIACPAWPTCGLSITESERALPGIIDEMEVEAAKHGLSKDVIAVHMTGCPNGCARPYTPDIGLVGRGAGEQYTLYLGGNALGTRIGYIFRDYVPKDQIVPTLGPIFKHFSSERQGSESFGDFCHRQGKEALEAVSPPSATASKE